MSNDGRSHSASVMYFLTVKWCFPSQYCMSVLSCGSLLSIQPAQISVFIHPSLLLFSLQSCPSLISVIFSPSSCLFVNLSVLFIPPSRVWGLMGRWVMRDEHGWPGLVAQHPHYVFYSITHNPFSSKLYFTIIFIFSLMKHLSSHLFSMLLLTVNKLVCTPHWILVIWGLNQTWNRPYFTGKEEWCLCF